MALPLSEVLALAEKHLNNGATMASSAELCLREAKACTTEAFAYTWAQKSLRYSVGIFHPDYKRVQRLMK